MDSLEEVDVDGVSVQVCQGDLTEEDVDVIVNAANGWLAHGGGVAYAISRKGGDIIDDESKEWVDKHGEVETGETAYTSGGSLRCKYVVHAVGPIWQGGKREEEEDLKNAVINSLKRCDELKMKSISFPAISSGIFGFPKRLCAMDMFDSVIDYLKNRKDDSTLSCIRFTNIDDETCDIFVREFNRRFPEPIDD